MKEDSQILLLSNLSSRKDGRRFASASSSSGRGSSSSSSSRGSSYPPQGTKLIYSSSPRHKSFSFDSKHIHSLPPKKSAFRK